MCNAARAFLAGHPGPALVPTSIMVCRIAVRSLTGRLVTLDVRSDFTISELISAVMGSAEAWASEPVGTAQKNIVQRLLDSCSHGGLHMMSHDGEQLLLSSRVVDARFFGEHGLLALTMVIRKQFNDQLTEDDHTMLSLLIPEVLRRLHTVREAPNLSANQLEAAFLARAGSASRLHLASVLATAP